MVFNHSCVDGNILTYTDMSFRQAIMVFYTDLGYFWRYTTISSIYMICFKIYIEISTVINDEIIEVEVRLKF